MNHSFDIEYAVEYGIEEAILIENFIYWISKNKANKTNKHNIEINGEKVERVFTYNSNQAFSELFPYMKLTTIRNSINKLLKKNVLAKGHFSSNTYDRTLWYCFVDEERFLAYNKKKKSISQNYQMEEIESENGTFENDKSLYKYKPNINSNINTDREENKESKSYEDSFPPPLELNGFISDEKLNQYIDDWKRRIPGYKPGFYSAEKQAIRTMLREDYKIEQIPFVLEKLKSIRESNHKESNFYKSNAFSIAFLVGKDLQGRVLSGIDGMYNLIIQKPNGIHSVKESLLVSEYEVYKEPKTHILEESYEDDNIIFDAEKQMVYFPDGEIIDYNTYAKSWNRYDSKYKNWNGEKKYAIGQ